MEEMVEAGNVDISCQESALEVKRKMQASIKDESFR